MINNYLKIAWRNLWKNKGTTFINLFGLTIGLSSFLLIVLYIGNELSFDRFQSKGNRIARVLMEYRMDRSSGSTKGTFTSTKVAPVFTRTFPEVEAAVRFSESSEIIKKGESLIREDYFLFADSSFLKVFDAELLSGDPNTALDGSHKIILTQSTAKKYFGNTNPVDQLLYTSTDSIPYRITGVIKDYPYNSQVRFDFLASFSTLGVNQEETYYEANYRTYLLLKTEEALLTLQPKIHNFMRTEMAGTGSTATFYLERFRDIHTRSEYDAFVPNTNISYLYLLAAVGILLLSIVCFTYINLSTAKSIERAREVGVRKAIGAQTSQLFWQFIGESAIVSSLAIALSILVLALALPFFEKLAGVKLLLSLLYSPSFWGIVLAIGLTISLLAGSYPALVLSGFQPIKVLKGTFKNTTGGQYLQKSLVVFQFGISIFLIVATLIIQKQLKFIEKANLGYDREHVIGLNVDAQAYRRMETIRNELMQSDQVLKISHAQRSPVNISSGYSMRTETMSEKQQIDVNANPVDQEYLPTMGLQLLTGENFSVQDLERATPKGDQRSEWSYILNESAAKKLGWTAQNAVGKRMYLGESRLGVVKGVVKDFHFQSMRQKIEPIVLFTSTWGQKVFVKIKGEDIPGTLAFLEQKWKQLVPNIPFEYRFLDDAYHQMYQSEFRLGKIMSLFTTLSVVLACLGLFGLTTFTVQQRVKEIGIRKVLGASVSEIVVLLSFRFLKLILLAFAIFPAIAWLAGKSWLADFAYRTSISWEIFAASGAGICSVALLTVSFQTIRAALVNPVKSLKSE